MYLWLRIECRHGGVVTATFGKQGIPPARELLRRPSTESGVDSTQTLSRPIDGRAPDKVINRLPRATDLDLDRRISARDRARTGKSDPLRDLSTREPRKPPTLPDSSARCYGGLRTSAADTWTTGRSY